MADDPDFTFEINAEAIMTVTFRREELKVKGDTPRDAVLGQDEAEVQKVYGIQNLRIADGAIMPAACRYGRLLGQVDCTR